MYVCKCLSIYLVIYVVIYLSIVTYITMLVPVTRVVTDSSEAKRPITTTLMTGTDQ